MKQCNAPVSTRFPVNRKDHTQKGPYLTCLLKRLIEKKISYEDPETQKLIKGKVRDALMWRLILNGCQGENDAIKEILNRVDGKLKDSPLIDQSTHLHFANIKQVIENASSNGRLNSQRESVTGPGELAP